MSATDPTATTEAPATSIPEVGTLEWDGYLENCGLTSRLVQFGALVELEPSTAQRIYERSDSFAVLDFDITNVIESRDRAADLTKGSTVPLLLGTLGPGRHFGVDELWPTLKGEPQLAMLFGYPDPQGQAELYPVFISETDEGLDFIPASCNWTANFREFARRTGHPADLDLLLALRAERAALATCLQTDSPCVSDLSYVAARVLLGEPEPDG